MATSRIAVNLVRPSPRYAAAPHIEKVEVPLGSTLAELAASLGSRPDDPSTLLTAAYVDHRLRALDQVITGECNIQFLDLGNAIGSRVYQRTVLFMLCAAAHKVYPGARLRVEHSLSNGVYCEIHGEHMLSDATTRALEKEVRALAADNLTIQALTLTPAEAIARLEAQHATSGDPLVRWLQQSGAEYVIMHQIGDYLDYLDGPTLPATGYVRCLALHPYMPGFIVQTPEKAPPPAIPTYNEQPKLTSVYREAERWAQITGIDDVATLNEQLAEHAHELIDISEAAHEKRIAGLADLIVRDRYVRLITIAGPSSSGKTTLSNRLRVQLRVNGVRPLTLHLDDYFKSRDDTPLDEYGNPDFEALEAIDLDLFNEHLGRLIEGETVHPPSFDFKTGRRVASGRKLRVGPSEPIIVEGIHGLNDRLTAAVPKASKFKIYISPLTQINIHERVRIHTTDARLLRRLVRDAQFRGYTAEQTLSIWPMVRRGEEKYIFPFQEDASAMFNSALVYELAVLKPFAERFLSEISPHSPNYARAEQLLWLLGHVKPLRTDRIPANSILSEFVGGSSFA